jgi:hypothetical protein
MREPKHKQIGSSVFSVMPLGAAKARSLSVKVARMVGPGMQGDWTLDAEGMVKIVGAIMMNANEDEVNALVAILAESTMIEVVAGSGAKVPFLTVMDTHLAGAIDEQMQWIAFAMEVHLGPLVAWLKGVMPGASAAQEKAK